MPTFQDTPLSEIEKMKADTLPTHIEFHERQDAHSSGSERMSHSLDFYQFEWFRFLVAKILICSIELSCFFLGVQDLVFALHFAFLYGGVFLAPVSVWAFSFVFLLLQHRRTTIKSILECYLHVPKRCHRIVHRIAFWTWLLAFIGKSTLENG